VVRFLDLPQRIAPAPVALALRVLVDDRSPKKPESAEADGEWERLPESLDLLKVDNVLGAPPSPHSACAPARASAHFTFFHFMARGFDEARRMGLQFEDE